MNLSPEQDAALDELNALGREAAQALQSPWEPRCVAAAFATEPLDACWVFTMQVWCDLDAVQSPLLTDGEFSDAQELAVALAAFGHFFPEDGTPEDADSYTDSMQAAVARGFSTRLGMRHPEARGELSEDDGFGEWLPLFTFLLAECNLSLAEARACPVAQAFALAATRRHLQGWRPTGTPYKMREVANG